MESRTVEATIERFTESHVELAALEWLEELGYEIKSGPTIAPGEPDAERADYKEVLLVDRLKSALKILNPGKPQEVLDEALRKLQSRETGSLLADNRRFHRFLIEGIEVEWVRGDGTVYGERVLIANLDDVSANDWLAVNQYTVVEGRQNRRPDVILFLNGLPIVVFELKNAADENADIWDAFRQIQTYKAQLSNLFVFNEICVISDGLTARVGTISADRERYMPWRTIEGEEPAPTIFPQLEVVIKGMFEKRRLLSLLKHFIVFEDDEESVIKKVAGYHQFHAVLNAVSSTVEASGDAGNRRAGVIWHTQGSGKSLTMVFFAGAIVAESEMKNPTLVVLTDRNDLDGQLYTTFVHCKDALRQTPVQIESRAELKELLRTTSGGIYFTTIQKFFPEAKGEQFPELSDRKNIVVIADEAHRSQYDFIDGFARHMRDALPNASFIGFTGTPIELTDKNTRAVFGDYISVYDIQRAVEDKATVPIYYESRLAKLVLNEDERPRVDPEFEEATEGEEVEKKEKLKTKWAALEALVGSTKRLEQIAADLVDHFENRQQALEGKAMIVCMSRRICVELYEQIRKLRPDWHHDDDDQGQMKVVMTGSASDDEEWQQHIRNKKRREALAVRFKNAADPLKIVLVRDMWLTGFDAPCMHSIYVDKPMKGHGLMQAIARVNRVFKDKPGGLVVDYLGIADQLKAALATYTESGGKGDATIDQAEAIAVMLEKYEICVALFHGFDWSVWQEGRPAEKLSLLPAAQEHILSIEDGKNRLVKAVNDLSRAFALSVPSDEAINIRDDVSFFQTVKAAISKKSADKAKASDDMEHAIRQLVSRAVASEGVVDIFAAAGLKKPDVSILSDEFLAEIRDMKHRNLAIELLRKLLNNEIKTRSRRHLIESRSFAELLENSLRRYQNRAIETAQVIEELIALAREMKQAQERGENLGLTDDEVAFYDALEVNDSAVKVLGDDTLKDIARELVQSVKANVTIDWTVRETARAKLRTMVKRILRKYGYPPDKQETATQTVLQQAALLCDDWLLSQ